MLNKLLGNVKLAYKLSLAFIMILIPLVITTFYLITNAMDNIDVAQSGREGIVVISPLKDVAKNIAQHRGASTALLSGDNTQGNKLTSIQQDVNRYFSAVNKALEETSYFSVESEVNNVRRSWNDLASETTNLSLAESVNRHNRLIRDVLALIQLVADKSGLSLDAYLDSYNMVVASTNELPNLANYLGIARSQGTKVLALQTMDEQTKLAIYDRVTNASRVISSLEAGGARIFETNPEAAQKLRSQFNDTLAEAKKSIELINGQVIQTNSFIYDSDKYFSELSSTIDAVNNLNISVMAVLTDILTDRANAAETRLYTETTFILIVVAAACFIAFVIIKTAINSMDFAITTFGKIAEGQLDNKISTDNTDEFGQLLTAIDSMQQTLKDKQAEVGRLTSAVDGSTTNIMMADIDGNIVYANSAVVNMLRKREDQLRTVFSSFSVDNVVGANFDSFHKNPAHQRNLLGNPANMPYRTEITVAGLTFELIAVALKDEQGNHLGSSVEWVDLTEIKDAQNQIENLINDAISGQLDSRIETSKYEGFMKVLGDNINNLMNAVVNPITEAINVAQALSVGDLSKTMDGKFSGEFLALAEAMNGSIEKLSSMVDDIRNVSTNVFDSAREIAEGNNELSHRTESQASSLEETASAMEELTSTVQQNAENATEASRLSTVVMEKATNGGDVVKSAITAMSDINKSSNKIADIISVIDEIAFQTNLLALNAAVEAARAGEQGRGFAVVAAEVRSLAQRSAGAAKEIKGLINASVEAVGQGTKLVDETGQTFSELVTSIEEVGKMIRDIDSAGKEQSAGIGEVSAAVSQMDEMTQQNAALVEEAAASSKAMEDQAQSLLQQVAFFNNDKGNKSAPKPSASQVKKAVEPPPTISRAREKTVTDQEWEEF
ncbi:methyl-accepting chemotaxis protein [Thalassotalea marina]|uniref:HAMP domain-containing protein n=1 Tax=Thalassotalea marina TaxID=1673741 RepID=A0A919BIA3_9GAMM|nr:methyl-accepting chemotaxis protein [Thalassotalea marina]GHF93358.1 hypothetical protein GCM10017161_22100 [Thalassotalea marina]